MKNLSTLALSVLSLASFAIAPMASAASPAFTMIGGIMVPSTFCTINADGTRGTRYDGTTYKAWLADHAFADEAIYRTNLAAEGKSQLEIEQLVAEMKKDAAAFQGIYVSRGQTQLCPSTNQ